ncbi:MAG: GCN5-related N-acetyltransferase [Frankiales bacterium]|nr:GCN5-related N-acetyltransferase [Frankiales bacterium]
MLSSVPLDDTRHTLSGFDSGEPSLDEWLINSALGSDARGITRTFVWTEVDTTNAIGYYSLLAHVLQRDALPKSLGRGRPSEIPAVMLARLALDNGSQGEGLGGALLADALERAALAARNVGARFTVVDALHENACAFYQHYGFKRIPDTLRLVQKMSTIEASLALG